MTWKNSQLESEFREITAFLFARASLGFCPNFQHTSESQNGQTKSQWAQNIYGVGFKLLKIIIYDIVFHNTYISKISRTIRLK